MVLTFILAVLWKSYSQLDRFSLQVYDLAIFDQATWEISRGHEAFVTVRGMHLLGDHFSLVIYLIAPLYWIWDSPKVLLTVQTVALAVGAFPVYSLAQRKIAFSHVSLLFVAGYLLFPALQWTALDEFHPEALGTPLLLGAFFYLDLKSWRAFFICLTIAALTKETAGLLIVGIGFYACKLNRKVGFATIVYGLAWLVASMLTIQHFNHGRPSAYLSFYERYGSDLGSIFAGIVGDLPRTCSDLNTTTNGRYIFQLLQPLSCLSLFAPEVLLITFPVIMANVLSSRPEMHTTYIHYTAFLVPCVVVAAIHGLARVNTFAGRIGVIVALPFLATCTFLGIVDGPFVIKGWHAPPRLTIEQARETRQILDSVPNNASITAQVALLPSVTHRISAYLLPNPFYPVVVGPGVKALHQQYGRDMPKISRGALRHIVNAAALPQFVAVAPSTDIFPLAYGQYRDLVATLNESDRYGIVAVGKSVVLFERDADRFRGWQLLERKSGQPIRNLSDVHKAFLNWSLQYDSGV